VAPVAAVVRAHARRVIRVQRHEGLAFLRMARRLAGVPVYWTGAYLVDGVLVDCGPPVTARDLVRLLDGERLDAIAITHHHEDHMGAAPLLSERGVPAWIHPAGIPLLRDGFVQEGYRALAWGRPARLTARPLEGVLETGRLRLEVVPTPGHSPDHVCFFEREKGWLFTGDLFLAERVRYLREDEDVAALVASLEAVCALPVRHVFCAHRGPVRDGPAALRRKRDNLVHMSETIRGLLRDGLSEREVARRAVGREGVLTWFSRGRFSARNFVRAVAPGDRRPLW
jgi:glyoxylase-like metal-dependent hydrolase (beta-lactamase superfamily II)